jgi:hypothetical protein
MEKYNGAVDLQYVSNMLIDTAILLQRVLPSSRCCAAVEYLYSLLPCRLLLLLSSRPVAVCLKYLLHSSTVHPNMEASVCSRIAVCFKYLNYYCTAVLYTQIWKLWFAVELQYVSNI